MPLTIGLTKYMSNMDNTYARWKMKATPKKPSRPSLAMMPAHAASPTCYCFTVVQVLAALRLGERVKLRVMLTNRVRQCVLSSAITWQMSRART